jgi:hypothetical protein
LVFNDGRAPVEVVQAGARFPVNFYIAVLSATQARRGQAGGLPGAHVPLGRDGRTIAQCRTKDTCTEN